jgi:hypothetical protein
VTDRGRPRWDTDERGHGIADAAALTPWIDELRTLVTTPDWVTEEPELHLLPHFERAVAAERDVALSATRVTNGVLEIDLDLLPRASPGRVRELAYRLVSAVGEAVTLVRQVGDHERATFEVVTGTPPGSSAFATHGHTMRILIRSPRTER